MKNELFETDDYDEWQGYTALCYITAFFAGIGVSVALLSDYVFLRYLGGAALGFWLLVLLVGSKVHASEQGSEATDVGRSSWIMLIASFGIGTIVQLAWS